MVKTIVPIFIAKTRSFWLGIVPAALTLIDVMFQVFTAEGNEPVAAAIAAILAPITGWTPDQIASFMKGMAPLYVFIIAQQRGSDDLIIGGLHSVELELAHRA